MIKSLKVSKAAAKQRGFYLFRTVLSYETEVLSAFKNTSFNQSHIGQIIFPT